MTLSLSISIPVGALSTVAGVIIYCLVLKRKCQCNRCGCRVKHKCRNICCNCCRKKIIVLREDKIQKKGVNKETVRFIPPDNVNISSDTTSGLSSVTSPQPNSTMSTSRQQISSDTSRSPSQYRNANLEAVSDSDISNAEAVNNSSQAVSNQNMSNSQAGNNSSQTSVKTVPSPMPDPPSRLNVSSQMPDVPSMSNISTISESITPQLPSSNSAAIASTSFSIENEERPILETSLASQKITTTVSRNRVLSSFINTVRRKYNASQSSKLPKSSLTDMFQMKEGTSLEKDLSNKKPINDSKNVSKNVTKSKAMNDSKKVTKHVSTKTQNVPLAINPPLPSTVVSPSIDNDKNEGRVTSSLNSECRVSSSLNSRDSLNTESVDSPPHKPESVYSGDSPNPEGNSATGIPEVNYRDSRTLNLQGRVTSFPISRVCPLANPDCANPQIVTPETVSPTDSEIRAPNSESKDLTPQLLSSTPKSKTTHLSANFQDLAHSNIPYEESTINLSTISSIERNSQELFPMDGMSNPILSSTPRVSFMIDSVLESSSDSDYYEMKPNSFVMKVDIHERNETIVDIHETNHQTTVIQESSNQEYTDAVSHITDMLGPDTVTSNDIPVPVTMASDDISFQSIVSDQAPSSNIFEKVLSQSQSTSSNESIVIFDRSLYDKSIQVSFQSSAANTTVPEEKDTSQTNLDMTVTECVDTPDETGRVCVPPLDESSTEGMVPLENIGATGSNIRIIEATGGEIPLEGAVGGIIPLEDMGATGGISPIDVDTNLPQSPVAEESDTNIHKDRRVTRTLTKTLQPKSYKGMCN